MCGETLDEAHAQMHGETSVDAHCQCGRTTAFCQHSTGIESDSLISDESGHRQKLRLQVFEDHRDCEEVPKNAEMKQVAGLYSDEQLGASVPAKGVEVPVIRFQENQMEVVSESVCLDVNSERLVPINRLQHPRTAGMLCQSVDFAMEEGCQGEASLEMLSVAVESLENMQRSNQEGSAVAFKDENAIGPEDEHVEDDSKNAQLVDEQCATKADYVSEGPVDSLMNTALVQVPQVRNLGIDITQIPGQDLTVFGEDFQNKTDFLNMLCELATVQQQEQEISGRHPDHVAGPVNRFDTSILEDDAAKGEPRQLSFVNLLRKQMVHAATVSPLTDLTADAERFYEEFMRKNQDILGSTSNKEFMPFAGKLHSDRFKIVLEAEQRSSGQEAAESNESTLKEQVKRTDDYRRRKAVIELGKDVLKSGKSPGYNVQEEMAIKEGTNFGVGDLVWAKVKSHPWWPGQIFDAADASEAAQKVWRSGRILVAFFGDATFGWLQQSQLIAFRPNFEEKVKQTTMKSFCRAVAEALDEVCRRTELGLSCPHYKGVLHSKDTFPDANTGMQKGVRIKCHQDISMSREMFKPDRVLEFVKTAACSSFHCENFSLGISELCGHAFGLRTFMCTPKRLNSDFLSQNMSKAHRRGTRAQSSKLKRRFSSIETDDGPITKEGNEAKKPHLSKGLIVQKHPPEGRDQSPRFRSKGNLLSTDDDTNTTESKVKTHEEVRTGTWLVKGKRLHVSNEYKGTKRAKRWHSLGSEGDLMDLGPRTGTDPDDGAETLFAIAGYRSKLLKKKRKGDAAKNTTTGSSKKVDKKAVEEGQEVKPSKALSKLRKTGEDSLEGHSQDSGNTPLSTTIIPHHDLSVPADTKEMDDAGEIVKEKKKLLNSKELPVVVLHTMDEQEQASKGDTKTECLHSQQEDSLSNFIKDGKTREDTVEGGKQSSDVHRRKGVDVKKPAKTVKLGDSIKHVAGELADTTSSMKSAGDSSVKKLVSVVSMKSGMKKESKNRVLDSGSPASSKSVDERFGHSLAQLLQGLQVLARDPLSNANTKSSLHGVTGAVLKFRSMVFLKSSGYGTAEVGKRVSHFENGNFFGDTKASEKAQFGTQNMASKRQRSGVQDSLSDTKLAMKTQPYSQNLAPGSQRPAVQDSVGDTKAATVKPQSHAQSVTPGGQRSSVQDSFTDTKAAVKAQPHPENVTLGSQKPGVQELAVAARNRKSEVAHETAVKMSKKREVTTGSQGQQSLKERMSNNKVTDFRAHGKNIKQLHFRRETSSVPDMKNPIQVSAVKVPETSLGLFMRFPQDFALPSEAQLKEAFSRFGALETAGVRVYRNASSAQVVFKHGCDAEAALKHARKNGFFGHTDVSYRLRHFSPSLRTGHKHDTLMSAKRNSSETAHRSKSSLTGNLEGQHYIRNSSSRTEPGGTGIPADSLLRHQEAIQSPSNHNKALNADFLNPPSVSSVNVPSGDIEDQMMKLLQQVSVIVSLSSLTPKAT